MKWLFSGLIISSIFFAILTNRISELSFATLSESSKAVELCIALLGSLCLWSGLMRIATTSGLTSKLSTLTRPLLSRIFTGLSTTSKALNLISMNIIANLLGVGNAATPLGIAAIAELAKEENSPNRATNNMILFVVLNTASLQLVPTTVSALRIKYGSIAPFSILPNVIINSIITVCIAVVFTKIMNKVLR